MSGIPAAEIDVTIPVEDALGGDRVATEFLRAAAEHAGVDDLLAGDLFYESMRKPARSFRRRHTKRFASSNITRCIWPLQITAPFSKRAAASLSRRNWNRERATITSVALTFHNREPVMSGIPGELAFPPYTLKGIWSECLFLIVVVPLACGLLGLLLALLEVFSDGAPGFSFEPIWVMASVGLFFIIAAYPLAVLLAVLTVVKDILKGQ